MQRILIIGCPGGGKTTFAKSLGAKLSIPVYHLDKYFWKENWTPIPQDEFRKIQNELMQENRWIIDGNFTKSIDNRIIAADTIILFDFPKVINIWRTLKRFLRHFGAVRTDMGGGNKEALQWVHIKYILTFPRKEFRAKITELTVGKRVIVLRNSEDVSRFFEGVQEQ